MHLELVAWLLPELYCAQSNYHYIVFLFLLITKLIVVTKDHPEGSVPALTALPRPEWAKIRKEYFSESLNQQTLEAIEEALFLVSLCKVRTKRDWELKRVCLSWNSHALLETLKHSAWWEGMCAIFFRIDRSSHCHSSLASDSYELSLDLVCSKKILILKTLGIKLIVVLMLFCSAA